MSLDDRIAAAFEVADTSLDPTDHAFLHALEAVRHALQNPPPAPGDTSGIEPWSRVSKAD